MVLEVLDSGERAVVVESEFRSEGDAHVLCGENDFFEEDGEIEEFSVVFVVVAIVDNRNAVFDLLREAYRTVIDEHDIREAPVLEYAQVLHVSLLLRCADVRAAFSVESM